MENKASCENCLHRGSFPQCCESKTVCDEWDGDCEICFFAGEPVLRKSCADCDWEDEEDGE